MAVAISGRLGEPQAAEAPHLIVGLNGLAGAGKTTAAIRLISEHGFIRVRFADPLKAMSRALGLSESDIDGDTKETPSPLLTHKHFDLLFNRVPTAFAEIGVDFDNAYATPPQLQGRQTGFAVAAFIGVLTRVIALGEKDGGATPRLLMQFIGTEWGRDQIHKDIWINLWKDRIRGHTSVVADDCRFPNEVQALRQIGGILVEIVGLGNKLNVGTHESEAHRFEPDYRLENNYTEDFLYTIDGLAMVHARIRNVAA